MPPCEEGVFTSTRHVFMRAANAAIRSRQFTASTYSDEVCPSPPSSTSRSALAAASSNVAARYMASTGESFSCANSSAGSTLSTSPMRIFVPGTSTPAISAMVQALWPTMRALSEPLMRMVLRTRSVSSPLRK